MVRKSELSHSVSSAVDGGALENQVQMEKREFIQTMSNIPIFKNSSHSES
jgi:hypothetical protein